MYISAYKPLYQTHIALITINYLLHKSKIETLKLERRRMQMIDNMKTPEKKIQKVRNLSTELESMRAKDSI